VQVIMATSLQSDVSTANVFVSANIAVRAITSCCTRSRRVLAAEMPSPDQGILRRNGCRAKRMDVWQRAVDTDRFNPAFRSDEWRSRITDGHPERVVLTYVGRLGAGASCVLGLLLLLPNRATCKDRLCGFRGMHWHAPNHII